MDLAAAASKKQQRLSPAMERTGEWIMSQQIPTDVSVQVGEETNFSLHKFPLVAKCGYIRRVVAEANDSNVSTIQLSHIPGGAEAFEHAAKFCYGINFEINARNVSPLRCAAEYLEMTEEYATSNLISRTEDYIQQVAFKSLSGAVTVLHSCQTLLPMAQELGIVSRCVDAVASMVCAAQLNSKPDPDPDGWAQELTVLGIDFYQRLLIALKAGGVSHHTLGSALMIYAHKSQLQGLLNRAQSGDLSKDCDEKEQTTLVEAIVSLLPSEKNGVSVTFLSSLLRAALHLKTKVECRVDMKRRIALQLDQATVDDLLLISSTQGTDELPYDVDCVHGILVKFLQHESPSGDFKEKTYCSPSLTKVCRLIDSYLGQIAPAASLTVAKFIGLAQLIPKHARDVHDTLYRAIDIYLKCHPSLNELEREKVCSAMDTHRLSYEARTHAAQNKRLPVQITVQVLYYDQLRLRSAHDAREPHSSEREPDHHDIHRENEELKLEVARMKLYVQDLQNNPITNKQKKTNFFSSVSKKLGKLNPFARTVSKDTSQLSDSTELPSRRRRYSIS